MKPRRTNLLEIHTPEGIRFSLTLAGPVTRFAAWFVDALIIGAAITVLQTVFNALAVFSAGVSNGILIVAVVTLPVLYAASLEWVWRGQTVGKRLLRLRVVDEQGLKLRPQQILIRNLLRPIDRLPLLYMVGGLACLISSRAQRLGDLLAGTIVIRIPQSREPRLDQIMAGRFNSFRDHPHLETRLRRAVSTDLRAVAMQTLARRDELTPEARLALFAEIADHLRDLVEFPDEATLGLTDEQYVRNAIDSVYRRSRETAEAEEMATAKPTDQRAQVVEPVRVE